jgi:20S proteasome alpha/beta subunit
MIGSQPKSEQIRHRRSSDMTFVIGFKCADGILLCADSLEADGLTKRPVNKIRVMGTTDWTVGISGAGAGGIIDKFCDEVSSALGREIYNLKHIEQTIEETLLQFRSKYQEDDDRFRILVGVYCKSALDQRLYRSDASHLVPIKDHAHIGTGHSLWRFLVENLYTKGNSVDDNSRLAIFIMKQAIEHVDGVEGPIQLASYTSGDGFWKFPRGRAMWPLETDPNRNFGSFLRDYWKSVTPPMLTEQVKKYGGVRTPGDELTILRGVETEKLQTVSGRRKNEGFLHGNTDTLRIRALLEEGRRLLQEGKSQ